MEIKIIDLLNKWVNGEEMPQKIMYDTCLYTYDEQEETYYNEEEETLWQNYNFKILTDEVEIIGEPKKIEKIARYDDVKMTHYGELYKPTENEEILRIKFNELIDEINNLKEK